MKKRIEFAVTVRVAAHVNGSFPVPMGEIAIAADTLANARGADRESPATEQVRRGVAEIAEASISRAFRSVLYQAEGNEHEDFVRLFMFKHVAVIGIGDLAVQVSTRTDGEVSEGGGI